MSEQPRLFGIHHSNRNFSKRSCWGKNQFNNAFPTALAGYMAHQKYNPVYLFADANLQVLHSEIAVTDLWGLAWDSDDLFFAFERDFVPYQDIVLGTLPRIDLVTLNRNQNNTSLRGLEIKLTALPDHTTCELPETRYGCEIVVRPPTIVYLAVSLAKAFQNDRDRYRDKVKNMKVIDLFCGCGGLSLGFQNAGYQILAAYDIWEAAINIYRKNFEHPAYLCDLNSNNLYIENFKSINPDLIVGGPPCQDFSSAGKRNENLGRGDLTLRFAEIIVSVSPQFWVMENVERFKKTQKYCETKEIFKQADYGLTEVILDASLCGVPQKRKRFFWIGIKDGEDEAIRAYLQRNLSQKAMTVRDYLGDRLGLEYYYRHPRSYKRRGIFSIDEPSPTIRGVNRPIPKTYRQHPGDVAPVSEYIRALTTRERSYLQTFPETFIFEGSKTDLEQMIGNAVPVKLAEYVAGCILDYRRDRVLDRNPPFLTKQLSLNW